MMDGKAKEKFDYYAALVERYYEIADDDTPPTMTAPLYLEGRRIGQMVLDGHLLLTALGEYLGSCLATGEGHADLASFMQAASVPDSSEARHLAAFNAEQFPVVAVYFLARLLGGFDLAADAVLAEAIRAGNGLYHPKDRRTPSQAAREIHKESTQTAGSWLDHFFSGLEDAAVTDDKLHRAAYNFCAGASVPAQRFTQLTIPELELRLGVKDGTVYKYAQRHHGGVEGLMSFLYGRLFPPPPPPEPLPDVPPDALEN
jgi:hypothetical protein